MLECALGKTGDERNTLCFSIGNSVAVCARSLKINTQPTFAYKFSCNTSWG